MAEVIFALLCDYALTDAAGKLSIIGIFDRVLVSPFPAMHAQLFLVARWTGDPGTLAAIETRIWSPSRELIGAVPQTVQFGSDGTANVLMRVSPLPLPSPGEYTFELLLGGASVHHTPLLVEPIPTGVLPT
jgi:hypothetical protein